MLERISKDILQAMKNKDQERLGPLRYFKSILMENKTAKKPIPELDVLAKHQKKLNEALEMYPDGSEQKLKTEIEIKVLADYLPKALTEDEVKNLINDIKANQDNPNMGTIMKELQPQIKGRFDGKKASELVKGSLGN